MTNRSNIRNTMGGMRNADMPFRRGQAGRAGTGPQDDVLPDKSVAGQVNKAAKTGKLDLASLDLTAIPPSLYTSLLGIPPDQLSRSPAPEKPDHDTIKGLASSMSTDLKLEGRGSREQAFGIKATAKEEWNDPEELTSFKADHNMIKEIEVEIGAFGGLKVLDVSHNQLTALPDTLADLLRLTSLNLSRNALSTLPPAILLLPKLEVLNLSHNALTSLSLQNGIEPSEDGLSYGAGFLSTSFSRAAANKQARPVLPILRSLDLGSNKISSTGLAGLKVGKGLQAMRVLNLEHNALEGVLDLEQVGMGKSAMGQLMSLVLRGNKMLRGTEGEVAEGCKVDLQGTIAGGDGGYSSSLATPGVAQCANTKYGNPSSIATLKSKPSSAHSGPAIQPSATIVYKTTPAASFDSLPLQIDMDVYLPPTAPSSGGAPSAGYPVVIWFHGGGLLQGNKENLPPHFRRLPSHPFPSSTTSGYEREHCIVISPNYRLAPQCPIIDILSDIRDCIAYVKSPKFPAALCKAVLPTNRADGQANMGVDAPAYKIDPNRICLSGGSAGGYLALLASIPMPGLMSDEEVGGYRGEMGIKCCAPFYPITDLTHEFWATKTDPVPWWSDSIPHEAAKPHLNPRDPPICTAISGGPRSILYPYMLQHALFPSLLFLSQRSIGRGLDGFRPTPESLSITHRLERLANLTGVNGRKVEGDGRVVPPVYMIYGTVDDKINPLDRDVEVLRRLEGQGRVKGTGVRVDVEHGKDHGFDESEEEECVGFREWLVENLF